MPHPKPGATITPHSVDFGIHSRHASLVELCLYADHGGHELCRLPMQQGPDHLWHAFVDGAHAGTRYGYRAHGEWAPDRGLWFDPAKLLVDPYAIEIDRPFTYDPILSQFSVETSAIVPKAIVTDCAHILPRPPHFQPGSLIYEVNVRALTMLHPDIPDAERGTVRALTHPSIIAHLKRLGVSAVELMPVTAWIDERHLPPLNLRNSWGYNPIAMMALDPRLCPGGVRELAETVAALHAHGIGTILDLVFNHTGESDRFGPILSMRGLDSLTYYRHPQGDPGGLVNDTGTGNTLACDHPVVRDLVLDTLRHFVRHCGVDGFRFDLAPVMGRSAHGFSCNAPLLKAMHDDPVLRDRVLIAEPWDIGPGGYQLGNFPSCFLEWNDRARDDIRQFWRGDGRKIGDLATLLAGSSNIFGRDGATQTRTVNFVAAHDGFSLLDLVSFNAKHNALNGEQNRDGHNENYSWNNGVEGRTGDPYVGGRRRTDVKALLSTLFMSRGTIMLMAGDEFGRTQDGNNNAYAQDNALTWLDWQHADKEIQTHAAALSALRQRFDVFSGTEFLDSGDVEWLAPNGEPMQVGDWEAPENGYLIMMLKTVDRPANELCRLAVAFNRTHEDKLFHLPGGAKAWKCLIGEGMTVAARSVGIFVGRLD
ncbi:MAG: glycogen debranching enzyme GlgX [Rhizobium sp.]|nr:glycogen debranching enzyme GlgX [Rhizobium sp.]